MSLLRRHFDGPITQASGTALEPYASPLDRRTSTHLLRRTKFGARPEEVQVLIGRQAIEAVEDMLLEARQATSFEEPYWITVSPPAPDADASIKRQYEQDNLRNITQLRKEWLVRLAEVGLAEKLTLFWHNHFVTSQAKYTHAPLTYSYLTTLQTHALGNFRSFVHAIGREGAMLIYLDGKDNRKGTPNENYARELLELFTMGIWDRGGQANYSQQDIKEVARALTGWHLFYVYSVTPIWVKFSEERFDDGVKEVFGRQGLFGYDDILEVIFEERAKEIAFFICTKLYREFVYETIDEAVVSAMAELFIASDFEIQPVLQALLSSRHFYEERLQGAKVKSPLEYLIGVVHDLGMRAHDVYEYGVDDFAFAIGQDLFRPPNVAGWPGHRNWLTTTTLPHRWFIADNIITRAFTRRSGDFEALLQLARQLHDPDDALAPFRLPVALAEHLFAVPFSQITVDHSEEPFAGDLDGFPIPEEIQNGPASQLDLAKIFLGNVPWYEWDLNSGNGRSRLLQFVKYLALLPEHQLT